MRDTAILLVDDHDENLVALEAVLEPLGCRLVSARSGEEALKALLQHTFAVILLDVQMPGLDGFETAELIRGRERTRAVPIIFVTAISKEPHHVFRGYGAGAVDYIFKPFDAHVLRSKVEVFVELFERGRAIAASEELLRATFEDAPIGMARAGSDGRLRHVNRALCDTLGREASGLVGRTLDDLGARDEAGVDLDPREALLAGKIERYEIERTLTGPAGTSIPVCVTASLARPRDGSQPDLILHVQDLRERRRAEREHDQLVRAQAARASAEVTAERLRVMQSIADAALAADSVEDLLEDLLARLLDALDVDRAAIVLAGEGEPRVAAQASPGLEVSVQRNGLVKIDGVSASVLRERAPLVIGDLARSEIDASSLGPAVVSVLAVPLVERARVFGTVQVGMLTPRDFDDETIDVLRLLADRVGLAITRTRLHERERRIARELQHSLLPKSLPEIPGVALAARYRPGGDGVTVGGDWYDAVALPGGRVAIAIGDVVGRGIAAASTMGQMRSALRAILAQGDNTGAMADRLNRFALGLGVGEAVMTTVVLAIYEPTTGALRFTNAGHPPALVLAPDGSASYLSQPASVPMGVLEAPRYPEHMVQIERGSTLILYTDGLVEEPTEVLDIGLERLLDAARDTRDDVEELCEVLLEKGLPPSARHPDDVTLLVLRAQECLGEKVSLEVSGEPGALRSTRDTLRLWLRESAATQDETDDITMACNEACENVVEHAYGLGDDPFSVMFARDGRDISIHIRDRGTWQGETTPNRGLGLELMRRLVDDVDVQSGPNGTTVQLRKRLAKSESPRAAEKKVARR
ncbi:MAG TPA: SpoIIE family protein phosphatase [Solirubrobacteraceae bacterium]|nr:SpoIIE family protein phosphatase [Solirubrobacteraceae bacterium]